MQNFHTSIISNLELSPGYFRMRILAPGFVATAKPGQFVMVRIGNGLEPLLRRPFGIFRTGFLPADCQGLPDKEYVEILYKVVGSGTALLRDLHRGDRVELLGPLGNGFDMQPAAEQILVGGGIGLVPLYMLARQLVKTGRVRLLMGGRCRDDILAVTEFERLGVATYVSTDDGSLGEEGLVTDVLRRKLEKFPGAAIYACGPMPMLRAVHDLCSAHRAPLQVSLEAFMACGVGACLGCVVKGAGHSEADPHYLCTCKEGPVFRSEQLEWDKLEAGHEDCGCEEERA
ncbi:MULTISPECIES: dihydroorotate dehydrogenase electron transfer subunit [Syntrophotalea]|jgi:dihydroorotate dehydrogenase electron transfer subunit|uniref:Dihydroorotate dehydrogenase B (NAD(+)), electron transfer subunit n=1 Tax=Syntrophotalea acetylenica TaxID=29542 RepID=A0A1L3GHW6_SYNAC|nr:dihydroorotate dehydrogenase electron transfer subunit [Syntrophotalea acetylenica]APG25521.1 dihydroorotate dehydrogenase [Syntrophotalea acetylenica]APG43586.1 dihydroorotate dehydrogenase [Syntrophotalea acetylenica]MDY0262097.1 dihydroorotate dehydrogenase electron transfer subunit [Syntrophotalea acetylenica]